MQKQIYLFLFFFLAQLQYAQKEANIWYFGNKAGLDFNTTPPTVLYDGQLYTGEGCGSICDANGQLLFYTDGINVWNKNHKIMPNGTGLLGDISSTQTGVIVPKPGSNTIYYIFNTPALINDLPATYSEVDLSLNGGLGDVTAIKNT